MAEGAALQATDGLYSSCRIGDGEPSFVIAEIGNNHNGDVAIALQLTDAQAAGADCAKFQMRDTSAVQQLWRQQ